MLANATEVKDRDRKAHVAKREELRSRFGGDELDSALDALETEWQLGETDRKQHYIGHALGIAAQALDLLERALAGDPNDAEILYQPAAAESE